MTTAMLLWAAVIAVIWWRLDPALARRRAQRRQDRADLARIRQAQRRTLP
jgi:hypothetical protein